MRVCGDPLVHTRGSLRSRTGEVRLGDGDDAREAEELVGGFAGAFGSTYVIRIGGPGCDVGVGAREGIEVAQDAEEDAHGGGEVAGRREARVRACAGFHLADAGLDLGTREPEGERGEGDLELTRDGGE